MEMNESMGVKVVTTNPAPYMSKVSIYTEIEFTFNADLDSSSISGNFYIFESHKGNFKSIKDLFDLNLFTPIDCRTSYKEKTVTLKPLRPLTPGALYITYIPEMKIRSLMSSMMMLPYTGQFQTVSVATPDKPEILTPSIGDVLSEATNLSTWTETGSSYNLQLSKSSTFETLIIDEVTEDPQLQIEPLSEGRYYTRVKALEGEWSELVVFFVKRIEDRPISHEDSFATDPVMPWENDFEVLETFPDDDFSCAATNLKTIYVKVRGELTLEDIEVAEMVGYLSDEDDHGSITPHGLVEGVWTVVYDKSEHVSYLIFTMDAL